MTPVYQPHTKGLVEGANHLIASTIARILIPDPREEHERSSYSWPDLLPEAVAIINARVVRSMGHTAAKLMFNRECQLADSWTDPNDLRGRTIEEIVSEYSLTLHLVEAEFSIPTFYKLLPAFVTVVGILSKTETISCSSVKRVRLTYSGIWRVVVEIMRSARLLQSFSL